MRLLANLAWLLTMGEVDLMPVAARPQIDPQRQRGQPVTSRSGFLPHYAKVRCTSHVCVSRRPCMLLSRQSSFRLRPGSG